ncbi:MAG: tyrosine-protein kinase domain-containing protein, partial [Planctomycetota bacterium]
IGALVERMGEVDLTGEYAKTNVKVVEDAEVPVAPVKPRKKLVAVQSVAVGLFLGVCLAFLVEYMDDTVKTPEDLEERVGLPVLGFVPAVEVRGSVKDRFSHRGKTSLVDPRSIAAEAYRHIRTNLFFSAEAAGCKVLAVTSAARGDGKTTTACNLALAMAKSGKNVLLVDADLRRPMVHEVFGLETKTGLSTVLVGVTDLKEAIQTVKQDGGTVENLHVLTGGPRPSNPAELLNSEGMPRFLDVARERYDWIVIDTTPVLSVADASIVGAISDGVVMVVKAATNSRALASRARKQLMAVNACLLGGVLNDVEVSKFGYYSDYYGYLGRDYTQS